MDCASEESIVRMKLTDHASIHKLDFDIPNRKLTVLHEGDVEPIKNSIDSLNFSSSLLSTEQIELNGQVVESANAQSKLLWSVLAINFTFFLIEIITGFLSRSIGLVADSLDMLADAIVYGLSYLLSGVQLCGKRKLLVSADTFSLYWL